MANFIYDKAADGLWGGDIAFDTDSVKVVLVDTASYTADKANDEFLSSIPGAAVTATTPNLTGKTISARAIDADDPVFTAVTGDESEALVLYQDTGVPGSSRLLAYVDTATGLPATPNGTDITIIFNVNGIAKL